jgi:hypothetical protein
MRPIFTKRSRPTTHQDCDGHRQLVVFQRILFICLLNLLANARNWGCYFEDLFSVPASVHDFISKFCKLAAVLQSLDKFICSMRLTMKNKVWNTNTYSNNYIARYHRNYWVASYEFTGF